MTRMQRSLWNEIALDLRYVGNATPLLPLRRASLDLILWLAPAALPGHPWIVPQASSGRSP